MGDPPIDNVRRPGDEIVDKLSRSDVEDSFDSRDIFPDSEEGDGRYLNKLLELPTDEDSFLGGDLKWVSLERDEDNPSNP
jgi:hypothetical protein